MPAQAGGPVTSPKHSGIARLLRFVLPSLSRHQVLLPMSGLVGALVVLLSDIVMRAVLGADAALSVPTGVATSIVGALVLITLARRSQGSAGAASATTRSRPDRPVGWIITGLVLAVAAAVVLALLAGYTAC
ncbi:iron chelate uptake ABC transporter family permease subunit [Yimella sp. cx-51]|uniref:iron chelate uptake ABC transporter family permease subunit n=1 Tax=Yimella sp. cx-51 TaxID=2770551 RepID=UPI00165D7DE6|nr:iron chelate uptake ABC transporter family permease subunit [Yimella sp. cx-51]MBC9957685.1 iron chelate uptake ABC transporter family permease subunit [Yimella sp. cx-51]QTH36961.1 iron chelate uptake ABC transporter family permease subunit [Yimella sp. cx-51]